MLKCSTISYSFKGRQTTMGKRVILEKKNVYFCVTKCVFFVSQNVYLRKHLQPLNKLLLNKNKIFSLHLPLV